MNRKRQPGWKVWHPPPQRPPSRWERLGVSGKTAWDWLNLLIVPLGLAFFAGLFAIAQAIYQQSAEEELQSRILDLTARSQRVLEEQRAQDATLQAYLEEMDALALDHHLRTSRPDSEVRTLAQARTITTVERLGANRRGQVLQFLAEAKLIQRADERSAVISLREADLRGVLSPGVDLSDAELSGADLSGADLSNAYLKNATVTKEQLEQAESLEGATMRNGQEYEDWLKDKE
jgi:uncharacterized protein YjbI with pentapeptide repeats